MALHKFSSPLIGDRSAPVKFKPKLVCHSWAELETHTNNCRACGLHKYRTQVVAGRYSQKQAELLIIGEGPGQVEDKEGLAFVGDSGKLLDIMLESVGLESWYITNVVRCRPPENRNPTKTECQSCWGFLQSEIALVKPKAILCLGKVAARTMLNTPTKFEKLLRIQHQYFEYSVWATYHPAYLLRQPQLSEHSPKWQVWQTLCQIKLYLEGCRLEKGDNSLLS
jgi:uracil-DNA glycosylase